MTPSRLTHVTWATRTGRLVGGAEHYIHRTATALHRLGIRNTLLVGTDGPVDRSFTEPFDAVHPLVSPGEQLRALRPDVVYAHQLAAEQVASLAASGTPVVRFFHDHAPFCLREHKFHPLSGAPCTATVGLGCYGCTGGLVRRDAKLGLARVKTLRNDLRRHAEVARFIVGSEYMRGHVVAHGLDRARVVHLPLFAGQPTTAPLSVLPTPGRLLFVGALTRGKGAELLLEALTGLPDDVSAVVVGEGPALPQLRRVADARAGLQGRVTFTGALAPAQVEAHMRAAELLVVPSRTPETFAMVGVEAAGVGLPAVAADVGGVRDWLVDGVTGLLVAPNDPAALADGIRRALGDRVGLRRMGRQARQQARTHFTLAGHVRRLVRVFEEVAA